MMTLSNGARSPHGHVLAALLLLAVVLSWSLGARGESPPAWASKIRDLQDLLSHKVIHWWIDHPPEPNHRGGKVRKWLKHRGQSGSGRQGGQKQIGNGEFGGGVGDDVELINGWEIPYLIAHDRAIGRSVRWLVRSVWSDGKEWEYTRAEGHSLLVDGFRDSKWDRCPEHSGENTSYSTPHMMLIEYGNPVYVEQAMATIKHMGRWTAINPKGHRHFRSYGIGPKGCYVMTEYPEDTLLKPNEARWSIPEVARPVKSGNYLVWYNGHPTAARWIREWSLAWVEDSRRTDGGKPAGIIPGGIEFADCKLGGNTGDWRYAAGEHSYDWEQVWPLDVMYAQMVTSYLLFGDEQFLEPVETLLEFASGRRSSSIKPLSQITSGSFGSIQQMYRVLTRKTRFDPWFLKRASASRGYERFLITGDKKHLLAAADHYLRYVSEHITKWTTSKDMRENDHGKRMYRPLRFLSSVCLGGTGLVRSRYPGIAVSWEHTGYDFAPLVAGASERHLQVLMYNFSNRPKRIAMRVWRLEKGTYAVRFAAGDAEAQTFALELHERAQRIPLTLPPRGLCVIQMNQTASARVRWTDLPDLGFSSADVSLHPAQPLPGQVVQAEITIHNIGAQDTPATTIGIYRDTPGRGGERLAGQPVPGIRAPLDFRPKTVRVSVSFQMPAEGRFFLRLDPEDRIVEIAESNNVLIYADKRLAGLCEIEGPQLAPADPTPARKEAARVTPKPAARRATLRSLPPDRRVDPAAEASLRKALVAIAVEQVQSGLRPRVFVEFLGRAARATIVRAGETSFVAEVVGQPATYRWDQLRPARFYGVVRHCVNKSNARHHLALARYCEAAALKQQRVRALEALARLDAVMSAKARQ